MAGLGIGGGGLLGIALEVTPGTYVAPTKFVPINSESIKMMEGTQYRRPIRVSVDVLDAVPGNEHPEGDIEMDAREDCVAVFMHAARAGVVKTGAVNFQYVFTGNANAIPAKTMSITVVRAGEVFAYTGMVVSSWRFSVSEGILLFTVTVKGRQEAVQSSPSPTWPTTTPYGMGKYSIEIPTASAVTDTDAFEFTCEDNAEPAFRLKSTGRGADFIKYGERAVSLTMARDFTARTDYDNFKSVIAQSITLTASKGANNSISLLIPNAFKDSYETQLSGQGELLRAQLQFTGTLDGASPAKSYQLTVKTQEDIVP